MNILYLDLFNGISGDMVISAFLNAGLPFKLLEENITKVLSPDEFCLEVKPYSFNGVSGLKLNILETPFKQRDYTSIKNSILESSLNSSIKEMSLNILLGLAHAESSVHQCKTENVHFHEIGAVDTIIDIVGVSTAIDFFKIQKVFVSNIPVGKGEISSSHGIIPNPAPATTLLLKGYKLTFRNIDEEITTPTGAAIIYGLKSIQNDSISINIKKLGYGFGKLKFSDRANCLRIFIGEEPVLMPNDSITEIEFNVDDMTGEEIGFFIEESMKQNILDIQCISSVTKKNRPGYVFKLLTKTLDNNLLNFIFSNTSTSGLRVSRKLRYTMKRSMEKKEFHSLFQLKRMEEDRLDIRKYKMEFDSMKKK